MAKEFSDEMAGNPLIVLSVTSAIVNFLNFGGTLLERAYMIHNSPDDTDFVPLESRKLIPVLSALNERLKRSLKTSVGCLSKDEQALENLSHVSSKVADDLLIRLDRIRAAEEPTQDRCSRQNPLKMAWVKEDLDTLCRRLRTFKLEIETQVVPFLKYVKKLSNMSLCIILSPSWLIS
jgi:hypothetical protein